MSQDLNDILSLAKTTLAAPDNRVPQDAVIKQLKSCLHNAAPDDPALSHAALYITHLHLGQRQPAQAANFIGRLVVEGQPLANNPRANIAYANALIRDGRTHQAIGWLKPRLARNGLLAEYEPAHNLYAKALMAAGRAADAAGHLELQLQYSERLSRDAAIAHTLYANALIEDKKHDNAALHLSPLLERQLKEDVFANTTYAKALALAGNPDRAIDFLRPLLVEGALLANSLPSHIVFANALVAKGSPDEAIEHLHTKTSVNGLREANPHIFYALCRAYFSADRTNEAIDLGVSMISPDKTTTLAEKSTCIGIVLAIADANDARVDEILRRFNGEHWQVVLSHARELGQRWRRELTAVPENDKVAQQRPPNKATIIVRPMRRRIAQPPMNSCQHTS